MYGLAAENITINRKALSELAQNEPQSFKVRRRAGRSRLAHSPRRALTRLLQALVDVARRQSDALDAAEYLKKQHGQK
jgi:hypothetical protein